MAVQMVLLDDKDRPDRSSIWVQLPLEARRDIAGLFAKLLLESVHPVPHTEEPTSESFEDPADPPRT